MIFKKQNPPDKAKELYQAGFYIGACRQGCLQRIKNLILDKIYLKSDKV